MNRIFLRACMIFLIACMGNSLYAQEFTGRLADSIWDSSERILMNQHGSYKFVMFNENKRPFVSEIENLIQNQIIEEVPNIEFKLLKKEIDQQGYIHFSYQQFLNKIRVEYSILKFHCLKERVISMNGEYVKPTSFEISNNKDSIKAFEQAKIRLLEKHNSCRDMVTHLHEIVYFPKDKQLIPCFKISISASDSIPLSYYFYISQLDYSLIYAENLIHTTDVPAVAQTLYHGIKAITTDSVSPTVFYLNQHDNRNISARSALNYNWGAFTFGSGAIDIIDSTNTWNTDSISNEMYYNVEKTWDYFKTTFNRSSFNDSGALILTYAHLGTEFNNAYWNGYALAFGDGDGISYKPFVSTDVIGHEFTHALTQHSANLVYSQESGALNESYSDIFGVAIDFYANPNSANFLLGDEISITNTPIRNMQDPNATFHPDTYLGAYWDFNQEVHKNSQVQNHWFYLLCQGGNGINDLGQTYSISPIGMTDGAAIAYRTLTVYLTPNSTYADARTYSIQSAIDLFGACSQQVIEVTNAWHAVGVGNMFSFGVQASFNAVQVNYCSSPATVSFINSSQNGLAFTWDFGDGTFSNAIAPLHTYSNPGIYTVSLIATNSSSCNLNDTMVLSNYITITNTQTPIAANCIPTGTNYCCGKGIYKVHLDSILKFSNNAFEGVYKDFTCGNSTTLTAGSAYPIEITTAAWTNYSSEDVFVYIDYNNDGNFTYNELSYQDLTAQIPYTQLYYGGGIHSGILNTNPSAVLNTPLRMRVISDSVGLFTLPCANPLHGQMEDYTVFFKSSTQAPIANFSLADSITITNDTVFVQNLSTNGPTSFTWSLSGGTISNSFLQNPTCIFNNIGTYQIKLVVSNSLGSDSMVKNIYVSQNLMCNPSNAQISNQLNGVLYDSGGPNGNFGNNENCSFLIDPGACTDSVLIHLDYLDLGYSSMGPPASLYIFEGDTTSNYPISNFYNNLQNQTIIAHSKKVFIKFDSGSFSVFTGQGFKLSWQAYQTPVTPLLANFSISNVNPALAQTVYFNDLSSQNASQWRWQFGDGDSSALQNPQHEYLTAGTFIVKLIVQDCAGNLDTMNQNIVVQASPISTISPSTISISLGCHDTATATVIIQNNGGGALNWQTNFTDKNVLIWSLGVDTSIILPNLTTVLSQYSTGFNLAFTNTMDTIQLANELVGKRLLIIPNKVYPNSYFLTQTQYLSSNTLKAFMQQGGHIIFMGDGYANYYDSIFMNGNINNGYGTTNLNLVTTSTPISNGLPTSLHSIFKTFSGNFTNTNKVVVYKDNLNNDVVSYIPYGLGKAIFIGFDFSTYNQSMAKILTNAAQWAFPSLNFNTNISTLPMNGNVNVGDSDTISVQVNSNHLQGGLNTLKFVVQTNDVNNLADTISIYLNVSTNICPDFAFHHLGICSGSIQFTDSTLNNPTNWIWDFGDGNTSSLQNPLHNYQNGGVYTVKLITSNGISIDSIIKVVTINSVDGPRDAFCTPMLINWQSNGIVYNNADIVDVQFNTINNNSIVYSTHYFDYSCTQSTNLLAGNTYVLKVTNVDTIYKNLVWIDFNNDGEFVSSELVASMPSGSIVKMANVTIPLSVNVYNTPLRMRVRSYYSSFNVPPNSCEEPYNGEIEDYTVIINTPQSLSFNYSNPNCNGFIVFDAVPGLPNTTWSWDFGDGNFLTTSLSSISHMYLNSGTYTVQVTAVGPWGNSTYSMPVNVNIWAPNILSLGTQLVGSSINYTVNSTSPITSYSWNLGNGQTSSLPNPSTVYNSAGTYIVSALVVDSNLCSRILYYSMTVLSNVDFVAVPITVYVGQSVQFTNLTLASFNSPLWVLPGSSSPTSTAQNVNVTYSSVGNYNATLIENNGVFSDTLIRLNYIHVIPYPPIVFTWSDTSCKGNVLFNAINSSQYTSFIWDFGDGNNTTTNTPWVTHQYTVGGNYTVKLIGLGPFGNDTIINLINVVIWNPQLLISGSFIAGTPLNFTIFPSSPISSFYWQFGDGNSSTLAYPSNTYTNTGTYIVTVHLVDINMCERDLTDTINIVLTNINNIDLSNSITVYPNPFDNYITIGFSESSISGEVDINLTNILGASIEKIDLTNFYEKKIILYIHHELAKGIYFLNILVDGIRYRYKLTKY